MNKVVGQEISHRHLGVATRGDLRAAGHTDRVIAKRLKAGTLLKVGRNYYVDPRRLPERSVLKAAAFSCWVTCFSAARLYGLWVPPGMEFPDHLTTSFNRIKDKPSRRKHAGSHRVLRTSRGPSLVVPLVEALTEAVRCGTAEQGLIVLESALNKKLVTRDDVDRVLTTLSRRKARAIGTVSGLSQSGTETAVKYRLERKGYRVRQQVRFEQVGWVDMVVGESLVIEADSFLHHDADRVAYRRDRERDARLISMGFTVLRLTYQQVFETWEETALLIEQALRARVHRRQVWGVANHDQNRHSKGKKWRNCAK